MLLSTRSRKLKVVSFYIQVSECYTYWDYGLIYPRLCYCGNLTIAYIFLVVGTESIDEDPIASDLSYYDWGRGMPRAFVFD
jgi:hypothetical protein